MIRPACQFSDATVRQNPSGWNLPDYVIDLSKKSIVRKCHARLFYRQRQQFLACLWHEIYSEDFGDGSGKLLGVEGTVFA